jgi:hypothetical protein
MSSSFHLVMVRRYRLQAEVLKNTLLLINKVLPKPISDNSSRHLPPVILAHPKVVHTCNWKAGVKGSFTIKWLQQIHTSPFQRPKYSHSRTVHSVIIFSLSQRVMLPKAFSGELISDLTIADAPARASLSFIIVAAVIVSIGVKPWSLSQSLLKKHLLDL